MAFLFDWLKQKTQESREAEEARMRAARQREERERQREERERQRQNAYRQRQQSILSMLAEDKLPEVEWDSSLGRLPFKFMRSEHLIHVFPDVRYYETRIKREIVGRSAGASVRVMKGVYLRGGASKGTPVESEEAINRGDGVMAVTTKHVYFHGGRSFRIKFDKMVAVEHLSDGVGITRDRANAMPEYFRVGESDADFAYQLIQMVPSLELEPGVPQRYSPGDQRFLPYNQGGDDFIYYDGDGE